MERINHPKNYKEEKEFSELKKMAEFGKNIKEKLSQAGLKGGIRSAKKRFGGKDKRQIGNIMRKVRYGIKLKPDEE